MKKIFILITSALLAANALNAQIYVSTSPQNKNAIIEEFTGVHCPNCPSGHTTLAAILTSHPQKAFAVAYHPSNSSYTEPYSGDLDFRRTHPNAFYATPYCGSSRFMPSAFVNRREWQTNEKIQGRADWTNEAATIVGEASPLNVGLGATYNSSSKILTINAEVYFTSGVTDPLNVYVTIAENDLVAQQSGGTVSYVHKHVFRESLVPQWGDPVTGSTTAATLFTKQYTFNNSTALYNMSKCEVTVFVYNTATEEVISGYQVPVGASSGISTESVNQISASLFPNPVESITQLCFTLNEPSAVSYEILSMQGSVIMQNSLGELQQGMHQSMIQLPANTAAGVYLLKLDSGSGTKVLKFQVL